MNFLQKPFLVLEEEINAGGIDHVPPALCLLPAHTSAHVPANVEATGMAGTNKTREMGTVTPMTVNCLILFFGLIT
jgi:hypothetical protein